MFQHIKCKINHIFSRGQIEGACQIIENPEKDAIAAFAQWTLSADKLNAWESATNYEYCYQINYAHDIEVLRRVDWSAWANLQSNHLNYLVLAMIFYL